MRCSIVAGQFLALRDLRLGHAIGDLVAALGGVVAIIRGRDVVPHVGQRKIFQADLKLAQHHCRFFVPALCR
jgi:hypothetical protein